VADLDAVYAHRFDRQANEARERIWPAIARYLQRFVDPDAPALEVACDRGYLIRNLRASERWAVDLRDMSASLPSTIRFVQASGLDLLDQLPATHFGSIVMSNYLEHLAGPDEVLEQLRVCRGLLHEGGRVIVLQPNIRLIGGGYWDFIDHRVALTEKSLSEAGELAGLRAVRLITRFLPYTTKGRLPANHRLVSAYLRFPPAWLLMGKQTLYVAERA
jgi:2-polyprenyl-3-methyl-5-hydroxy-6-metoxy-1,4-benzoquinol methylase